MRKIRKGWKGITVVLLAGVCAALFSGCQKKEDTAVAEQKQTEPP